MEQQEIREVVKQAWRGNPDAIAALLNEYFQEVKQVPVRAKVRREGSVLFIVLISDPIPEKEVMVQIIGDFMKQLQPKPLKGQVLQRFGKCMKYLQPGQVETVNIYGQQNEQSDYAWRAESVDLKNASAPSPQAEAQASSPSAAKTDQTSVDFYGDIGHVYMAEKMVIQSQQTLNGIWITRLPPEQVPLIEERSSPITSKPHPNYLDLVGDLLDRQEETEVAIARLETNSSIELLGEEGVGKTALLGYLGNEERIRNLFADVVLHTPAHNMDLHDLFQFLFDSFYTSSPPTRLSVNQIKHRLQSKRAFVLLDNVQLAKNDVEELVNGAGDCSFLLTGTEEQSWGVCNLLMLRGLPREDALTLIQQFLERKFKLTLNAAEQTAADTLQTLLEGHPKRIFQALGGLSQGSVSLVDVVNQIQSASSDAVARILLQFLPEPAKQTLAAMATLQGFKFVIEQVADLTEIPAVESVLQELQERGLVQFDGSHYSLDSGLNKILQQPDWKQLVDQWREPASHYLQEWVQAIKTNTDTIPIPLDRGIDEQILIQIDGIRQHLEWAVKNESWEEVLELGKTVEGPLYRSRKHIGLWGTILGWLLMAARALADVISEAYILHQLGTRALLLGETSNAYNYLTQATQMRQRVGDIVGATVSRNNLEVLLTPLQVPSPSGAWLLLPLALLPVAVVLLFAVPLLQPKPPVVELSTQRLDFGKQQVGTTSNPQNATLTNIGEGVLKFNGIRISGGNDKDFIITSDTCSVAQTLDPRSLCKVEVRFKPTTVGDRTSTVIINNNAADSPQQVTLTGIGTSPPPSLYPALSVEPRLLLFGEQEVGTASPPQTIKVISIGTAPVRFSDISIAEGDADSFYIVNNTCSTTVPLKPKDICTVSIIFRPAVEARQGAILRFTNNEIGRAHV